jgi:carboxylesterase
MIHIAGLPAQIAIKFAPLIALFRKGLASVSDDVKAPNVTEWGYDVLPTLGVVQLNRLLKATRSTLGQVQAPTLIFHSLEDHVLPFSNTEIIMAEIGSAFKSRKELFNSYHVATLDNDAPEIFNESLEHIKRWS